jgi:inosine/xanthosine triphosphate pyrophosphatase family protein
MAPHKVNFITGNANKLTEVKAILEPEIEVLSQPIDLEEVQGTLEGVTEYKCRRAADLVGICLLDNRLKMKACLIINFLPGERPSPG